MGYTFSIIKMKPKLRLLWCVNFVRFLTKLGVKTSDITTLYGYEYITRSIYLKSLGLCTVWKGWKKLVHSVTLHCSHISIFFMLFMPSHPCSLQAGSHHPLCLFCSRWYRRLSRKSFFAPVCRWSDLIVILNLFLMIYISRMILSPLLSLGILPPGPHIYGQWFVLSIHSRAPLYSSL